MSDLTNIIRKELKELLTPGSVASIVVMVLLFVFLGNILGSGMEKMTETPVFGIVGEENGEIDFGDVTWSARDTLYSYYRDSAHIPESEIPDYIISMDGEDIYAEMQELGIRSAIVIGDSFSDDILSMRQATIGQCYIYIPSGLTDDISTSVVGIVCSVLNDSLCRVISEHVAPGVDHDFISSPISQVGGSVITFINGEPVSDITPMDIMSSIMGQTLIVPIVIMIVIMMIGSIVISSMGSEKENKTLETLLTLPIKRTTIVSGKIAAAAIVGMIYGLAYMVGMVAYIGGAISAIPAGIDMQTIGFRLGVTDYILIGVSMFLAILCALGICMILGTFAKNYKSAQTLSMPLSILAIVPMFINMFFGWYGANTVMQVILFAIPFSHPMMAIQSLMLGDVTLVLAGIAYMAVFAAVTILVTVKLYSSDILITGLGQNRYVQRMTGRK